MLKLNEEAHLDEKNKPTKSLVCSRIERKRKRDRILQKGEDLNNRCGSVYRGHEQEAFEVSWGWAVSLHGTSSSKRDFVAGGPVR